MKFNKLKSIFLSSALAISIFFTGCSNGDQNTITNQTQIKDSTSSNSQVSVESNSSYQDSSSSKEVPKGSVKATVERVVDGDTMKLKLDKTKEVVTLRLLLVDTPIEASNFAKNTLKAGDTVYIEYDEGDKTDKYDRHLGYLWYYSNDNSNWQMFNETLISQGYARVGYIYSQKRHLDEFYKAQDYAKSNKLNIWSVDGYVTDRGYDVDAYNSNKNTSSNSSSSSSNIVYANGGSSSSNKYHSTKDAHNMKGAVKMTEKEAKSKGYVPCGLCY